MTPYTDCYITDKFSGTHPYHGVDRACTYYEHTVYVTTTYQCPCGASYKIKKVDRVYMTYEWKD